ncbi:MAG: type II toxin-antitoxin system RelB/DinJ family antitoxin [Limisphaerales bacterium]
MGNSTTLFRARIDKRRVEIAERILSRIGLTPGQYVNMAFAQVELKNGIPFPLTAIETDDGHLPHIPNLVTAAALAEPVKGLRRHSSVASALGHVSARAQGRSKKSV